MIEDDGLDELMPTPGFPEMEMAWQLLQACREMKQTHGRLWAIAATDAEKLYSWISYAAGTVDDEPTT